MLRKKLPLHKVNQWPRLGQKKVWKIPVQIETNSISRAPEVVGSALPIFSSDPVLLLMEKFNFCQRDCNFYFVASCLCFECVNIIMRIQVHDHLGLHLDRSGARGKKCKENIFNRFSTILWREKYSNLGPKIAWLHQYRHFICPVSESHEFLYIYVGLCFRVKNMFFCTKRPKLQLIENVHCCWLDANRGPLVLKAMSPPTYFWGAPYLSPKHLVEGSFCMKQYKLQWLENVLCCRTQCHWCWKKHHLYQLSHHHGSLVEEV